ncbi:UNVERIFIED_CONTAM: hypothetical protein GTU68_057669 [Idotea baltica]|nr:hypothetical protein [Idotea baltica]
MHRQIASAQSRNMTIPKLFMENVAKNPNKAALIFEGTEWTFAQIDEYSNRVANFLIEKGFKRQQSVSLFMENRPEFVATWLGCAKVAVVPALINSNLRKVPLVHSIKIVDSKAIIVGAELQHAIADVFGELNGLYTMVSGLEDEELANPEFENLNQQLSSSPPTPASQIADGNFTDNLLYIYTSGTTGLPKAAVIKNSRYMTLAAGVNSMADIDEEVIYNPLPLYHTAGGLVGIGQVLIFNCTAVIRKKFSVSNFWPEAKKYDCTVAQYVGEICRYLLNSPSKPVEREHKVRVMFGNGVRAQIWEEFTSRFNMPRIAEFYGATEGIANIMNIEGKPGACGFLSVLFPMFYPARLIKVNPFTGEAIRGDDGLCLLCKPGEPGEFVGKIRKDPLGDFHGYADKKATEKKIIRDVFRKGDSAFASGDILVMDEYGYVYFKDRLGDTFRWRGENVSTTEVEGVVSLVADHKDAVVYGVEVPHTEGRAGMAAIVDPNDDVDMDIFSKNLPSYLPPYALPLFVRIIKQIDTTGTFKLKKLTLQKEAYNLNTIEDKLYFLDSKKKVYVPLTKELYDKIESGKVGL